MTYIFDIDGTLVDWHTNEWLEGAKENLLKLHNEGHRIILITARNEINDRFTIWSPENTQKTILKDLKDLGVDYTIIFDVPSPRTLIDDKPCKAITRKRNSSWNG